MPNLEGKVISLNFSNLQKEMDRLENLRVYNIAKQSFTAAAMLIECSSGCFPGHGVWSEKIGLGFDSSRRA